MASHRTYTEDEIASALATLRANNGNAKKTAHHLGISRTTLRQWAGLSPIQGKQVTEAQVANKSEQLANKLDVLALRLVDKVSDQLDEIPAETSGDVKNLLVAAGITIEKASFARGGPTNRNETGLKVSLVAPDGRSFPSLRAAAQASIEGEFHELALTEPRKDTG